MGSRRWLTFSTLWRNLRWDNVNTWRQMGSPDPSSWEHHKADRPVFHSKSTSVWCQLTHQETHTDSSFIRSRFHSLVFSFIIQKLFLEHPLYFTPQCEQWTFVREQTGKSPCPRGADTIMGETDWKQTNNQNVWHVPRGRVFWKCRKRRREISPPFQAVMKETPPPAPWRALRQDWGPNLWPPRCSQSPGTNTPHHIIKIHWKTACSHTGCWELPEDMLPMREQSIWAGTRMQISARTETATLLGHHTSGSFTVETHVLEIWSVLRARTVSYSPRQRLPRKRPYAPSWSSGSIWWTVRITGNRAESQFLVLANLQPSPLRSNN